jgi:hypothetical protein
LRERAAGRSIVRGWKAGRAGGAGEEAAMSAGQNLRRGYAYGVHGTVHSGTIERRSGSPDMVSLIVLATIVVVIAAVASDPVLSASFGQVFGTAWSETIAFLMRLVSR